MIKHRNMQQLSQAYEKVSPFCQFQPFVRKKLKDFKVKGVFVPGSASMRSPHTSDVLNALYLSDGNLFHFVDPLYDSRARNLELSELELIGKPEILQADDKVMRVRINFDGKQRIFYFVSQDATMDIPSAQKYEFYMVARRLAPQEGYQNLHSPENLEKAIQKLSVGGLYMPNWDLDDDRLHFFYDKPPEQYGLIEIARQRGVVDKLNKSKLEEICKKKEDEIARRIGKDWRKKKKDRVSGLKYLDFQQLTEQYQRLIRQSFDESFRKAFEKVETNGIGLYQKVR